MEKKIVLTKMVMPAIYNLKGYNWGWHKMKDLTKVVNIFFRPLKLKTDPVDLVLRFWGLDEHLPCGVVWAYRGNQSWLRDCVAPADFNNNAFVVAKWGIDVIKLAGLGITRVESVAGIKKAFDEDGNVKLYRF